MRSAQMIEDEEALTDNQADFHLGMGSLIGIFFGLAVVCGVFFGFGYMMGHRTPGVLVPSEPLYVTPATSAVPTAPKPSAQVTAPSEDPSRVVVPTNPSPGSTPSAVSDEAADTPTPAPIVARVSTSRTATRSAAVVTAPTPVALKSPVTSTGTILVQIAAVRSRPDAEALASALRKNGFDPTVRADPLDKLLHVQIGPFDSRDEAKSMRQKLANAGYNAFIK